MKSSEYIFKKLCRFDSDINEHLPTLKSYAQQCTSIVELGVCDAVSTWAFIEGLRSNKKKSKTLLSVDINDVPDLEFIEKEAAKCKIDFTFIKENSIMVNIPENTDLLFIDTWHVYGHLKRELEAHHRNVRKYIIMHDTEVDKMKGECLRVGTDPEEDSARTGYPVDEITKGVGYAIVEFLETYKDDWQVQLHYMNNNGLTILERISK